MPSRRLGISPGDLAGLREEDLAGRIAGAFGGGDPQALIAPLRTIGGKAAGALIPAMSAFDDLAAEARRLGYILKSETITELLALRTEGHGRAEELGTAFSWLRNSAASLAQHQVY